MEEKENKLNSVPSVSVNVVAGKNSVKSAGIGDETGIYVCNVCGLDFSSSDVLNNHLDSLHVLRKERDCFSCGCFSCSKKFQTSEMLMNHLRLEHTVQKFYSCGRCGEEFARSYCVPTHSTSLPPSRVFCSRCVLELQCPNNKLENNNEENALKSVPSVSLNITADSNNIVDPSTSASSDDEETESYICQICQVGFSSSDALDIHHRALHVVTRFSCSSCKEEYKTLEVLMHHLRRDHTEQKVNLCSQCGQKINGYVSGPKIYCDQCMKESENENGHIDVKSENMEENSTGSVSDVSSIMTSADNYIDGFIDAIGDHETEPYVCRICQLGVSTSDDLNDHLRSSHVVKSVKGCFSCVACKKTVSKFSALINHLRRDHTVYKIHSCGQCGQKFPFCHSVRTHYGKMEPSQMYCGLCLKKRADEKIVENSYYDPEDVTRIDTQEHSKSVVHDQEISADELFACHDTDEEDNNVASSNDSNPKKKEELTCQTGSKKFCTTANLLNYQINHCSKYSCEVCDKTYSSSHNLKRHLMSHSGERPFLCQTCGKAFTRKQLLEEHQLWHSGYRPFVCDLCQRGFTRKSLLQEHWLVHIEKKPFRCEICHRKYSSRAALSEHRRKHKNRKFSCDVCSKTYLNRNTLYIHKRVHTGERPYTCEFCDKAFADSNSCRRHLKIHSGERPYACDACGKDFNQKTHLLSHLRVHTGEKPYSCDICRRMFSHKANMMAHRRIHSSERSFSCNVCQRSFVEMGQLRKHQLRKHGID